MKKLVRIKSEASSLDNQLDKSDLLYAKRVTLKAAYRLGIFDVSENMMGDGLFAAAKVWVYVDAKKKGMLFEGKRVIWKKLIHKFISYELVNSLRRVLGRMPTNHKRDAQIIPLSDIVGTLSSEDIEARVIANEILEQLWNILNEKQRFIFKSYWIENRTMEKTGRLIGKGNVKKGVIWYHIDVIRRKAKEVRDA